MPKAPWRVMKGGKKPKWAGSSTQTEINRFKPRPMTGFLAALTPEQRTSALQGYEGDDTIGDRSKI